MELTYPGSKIHVPSLPIDYLTIRSFVQGRAKSLLQDFDDSFGRSHERKRPWNAADEH
jgi:hypothetical protein